LSPAPAPSLYLHRLLSYCYGAHRDLHSFPTRRSSDLHAIRQMPRLAKQLRDQLTALNEEMLETAIEAPLAELAERYRGHDGVQAHLASLRKAMLQHVDAFIAEDPAISPAAIFSRFHINLLVDNTTCEGAPVVYVDLPTHQHLVGRI